MKGGGQAWAHNSAVKETTEFKEKPSMGEPLWAPPYRSLRRKQERRETKKHKKTNLCQSKNFQEINSKLQKFSVKQ